MTLRDYYRTLKKLERPKHPALVFIEDIAELTGRSPNTVRMWLSEIQIPPPDICSLISKKIGISPEELFPVKNP